MMLMGRSLFVFGFASAISLSVSPAWPQAQDDNPLSRQLFPPEVIMKHAGEVDIDEEQRAAIKDAIQKAQGRFIEAQWELQAESEKMVRLLQARRVDEAAALAQADRVMDLERQIKKTQLSLLISLKNLLTDAQQAKLRQLRGRPAAP
jgi:Spy/CpxP family protein refolding chaperone